MSVHDKESCCTRPARFRYAVMTAVCALGLLACSGDDGSDGAAGAAALVVQTVLAEEDDRCISGGFLTESGTDGNGNGILDSSEITNSSVTCNGNDATGSLPFEPGYQKPNIILIIADDVGVDQFASFGFGGIDPPPVPTLDELATSGIRFANTWSNPTCSASRVSLFTGRYPTRTEVNTAIVSIDLANSQMSPYERSLPKILARSGYASAYVGKIHASGSSVNPDHFPMGDETINKLGWDFFAGYYDGGPFPIDTAAGLTNRPASDQPFTCGFIPKSSQHPQGADSGACYTVDGMCEELSNTAASSAGKQCLDKGGILDPDNSCSDQAPDYVDFTRQNAYYTANLVVGDNLGTRTLTVTDAATRKHRTQLETDLAIDWIAQQPDTQPWMLTVGYSAAHAPLQPIPDEILPDQEPLSSGVDCTGTGDIRALMNQNLSAIDSEVGRLLKSANVMSEGEDGQLFYNSDSNTVVAFIGDNGSLGTTVKAPFVPGRAKASAYQGGIWVPMIVTAPALYEQGRRVNAMSNIIDLYDLFSTLAEQEISTAEQQRLDTRPLLPYLTDSNPEPQRSLNFSYSGRNIQTETPGPCVLPSLTICLQIFPQQAVCQSEGGDWYGEGGVVEGQSFTSCCAVNAYFEETGQTPVAILAETQATIRNDAYKLLRFEEPNCDAGGTLVGRDELYNLRAGTPNPEANLDNFAAEDLLKEGEAGLTAIEQENYELLAQSLNEVLVSETDCPGDGNMDYIVDELDLDLWAFWADKTNGKSSWYDFNKDGLTDKLDHDIITNNLGLACFLPQ